MKNSHHHIRDSSLTRGGRGRDSSLPRFKEGHVSLAKVPSDLVTSLIAVRHNLAMPELGAETMKYNRQNAVKDIHSNFMTAHRKYCSHGQVLIGKSNIEHVQIF